MTLSPLARDNDGRDPSRAPRVPYYSLWSAPNGTSGLASCALDGFEMKSVGGQAAPMGCGKSQARWWRCFSRFCL